MSNGRKASFSSVSGHSLNLESDCMNILQVEKYSHTVLYNASAIIQWDLCYIFMDFSGVEIQQQQQPQQAHKEEK